MLCLISGGSDKTGRSRRQAFKRAMNPILQIWVYYFDHMNNLECTKERRTHACALLTIIPDLLTHQGLHVPAPPPPAELASETLGGIEEPSVAGPMTPVSITRWILLMGSGTLPFFGTHFI
jgi:hypothetical protein